MIAAADELIPDCCVERRVDGDALVAFDADGRAGINQQVIQKVSSDRIIVAGIFIFL